ncbi:MAG TPA: CbiX/SirB N-terminal domain-containing protein [Micromonosporaceae bacterium]|jgi:sirohydrochlorin ferrochelatase|nr:CbiX/SirB N-terminal domain-containing protein [Micromonosporaceae bacterium]
MTALLLVAHGSRDPRAAASTRALVRAVAAARPGVDLAAAYLDHTAPAVPAALRDLVARGHTEAVAVPLLLTEAYHGRVDLPAVLAEVRAGGLPIDVRQARALGGPAVVGALRRRLAEISRGYDGLVLAAAGTRDESARETVAATAQALSDAVGVPCRPAYASAAAPTPGQAVAAMRSAGARRVVVSAYFLAPGLLYERALSSAMAAGAIGATAPLGAAPELVELIVARAVAPGMVIAR